jgi:predicted alpha/beta-fold hydrolase
VVDEFAAAAWLPGAHLQTVWGRLARPHAAVAFRRETVEAPDGDELHLDHAEPAAPRGDGARVLILHGLEGSSASVYVQGLAGQLLARGVAVTVLNFRYCARDPKRLSRVLPNRRPRLYHSGETTDLDFVARTLAGRFPAAPLGAAGVSLGGNALLKWLGEDPAHRALSAVATISVPYDLEAGARHLERLAGRLYVGHFVRSLTKKALDLRERFPELRERVDLARLMRARTFYELDGAATAPMHGFTSAEDYWTRSSSLAFVSRIETPALCLSSEDDPFLPPEVLPRVAAAASPSVELRVTPRGGHAGFVGGAAPWAASYWAERTAAEFLASRL